MNKHMKRLVAGLLLLFCAALYGCNAGVISTEPSTVAESTVTTTAGTSNALLPTDENVTEAATTETESSTASATAVSTTAKGTTTQNAESTTAAATTATPDKKPTTTTTEATTTTEKKTDTCTLTIDASAAGQGYFLSSYAVKVKNGDTAYDILCRACEANGISINAKTTGYGIYVAGINGLDEKEVGNSSGWLYYVNGTPPNKACSKYKVAVGDKITFYYTVDYSTP